MTTTTTTTTATTTGSEAASPTASQEPVQQVLSEKLTDTTDDNSDEMFGEAHVTAFDRDEAEEAPAAPAVAPTVETRPEVPAVALADPAAPAAPAESSLPSSQPPAAPAAAASVPPAPQPVVPQAPTETRQPPAVSPQAPAVAAAQPATASTPDMAATVRALQEQRTQVEAALAQHYGLTQEEADAFATDPAGALPKMAARVHINAVAAALNHVAQHLPQLVNGMLEVRQRSAEAEKTFYERWPQLDRSKHDTVVKQMAQVYRQMNPNASSDDFIRHVGAQAVVALGLLQPGASVAPAQPQAPARQAPFVPAAISAPAARAGGPTNKNLFELYNEMLLNEDG